MASIGRSREDGAAHGGTHGVMFRQPCAMNLAKAAVSKQMRLELIFPSVTERISTVSQLATLPFGDCSSYCVTATALFRSTMSCRTCTDLATRLKRLVPST